MADFYLKTKVGLDTSTIQSDLNKLKPTLTVTTNLKGGGTKEVTTYIDKLGNSAKVVKTFNTQGKETSSVLSNVRENTKGASTAIGQLGKDFVETTGKVLKFGLSTAVIGAFTAGVNEAIKTVKDFDDALTDFRKVSDLSGDSLNNYVEKLGDLGETVARTTTQMVESATEFKKSGYSDEDSARLARIAEEYKNIADAELSSSESAGFIISQMKAYGNETENFAQHTIDAVNNISNNMAVSSSDVSEGLTKSAAGMSALGNSFEETASLVSAGSEIMTNQASRVSRGLMTIGNNIAKLAQTSDTMTIATKNGAKSIELINSETGDLNSTYKVLEQISSAWGDMSKEQQTNLAITLSGKNQFAVFNSVVSNFADAQKSLTLALNSAGSAEAENAKYLDSLQGKMAQLKQQFQKLVLGDGGLQDFVKKIIDAGTAILKFANSDIGQFIIKTTALISVFILLNNNFTKFIDVAKIAFSIFPKMASGIKKFVEAMIMAKDSTNGLKGALELLNINPVVLAITALVGAMATIVTVAKKSSNALDDMRNELSQVKSEASESQSAVDETSGKLEDIKTQIDNIDSSGKISLVEEKELQNLQVEKENLESILAVQQDINDAKQTELELDAQKTINASISNTQDQASLGAILGSEYSGDMSRIEAMSALSEKMTEYYQIIDILNRSKEENISLSEEEQTILDEQISSYGDIQTALDNATGAYNNAKGMAEKYAETLQQDVEGLDADSTARQQVIDSLSNLGITLQDTSDKTKDNIVNTEDLDETYEEQANVLQETSDAYNDAISSVGSLGDSYDQLASAVNEYNSSGSLSFETLSKLLSMGSEYLSLLQFENGQMSINEAGFQNLANAMIDDAEAKAISSAEAQILANANNTAGDSASNLGSQASGAVSGLNSANQAIVNLAISAENGAYKVNALYKALGGTGNVSVQNQEVVKSLASQINALESARKSIGSYTKATGKSSKATGGSTKSVNKNTEALKKQKEALDDIVKEYEKVISYIKSKVKDYVGELEDARDAEVDALDDQIDKLDELKDAEIDAIELEIDALKEKQNAEEKYWQDKIDALKAQNDAIQDQIDLQKLLDNLEQAKAKKVKVYREGKGFVYETDTTEVSKAQQELDDYLRKKSYEDKLKELEDYRDKANDNYEKQLDDLDKYKDSVKNNYDNQISNLKAQQDQIKKAYQEQIDYYNNWLKQFEKGINAYETEQNRLKALELTGIDFENDAWKKRNKDAQGNYTSALNDLKGFVDKYYEYQKQLATITEQINKSTSSATSGGGGGGGGGGISISTPTVTTPTKPYTVFEILGSYNTSTQASTAAGKAVQSASSADKSKIGAMSYGGKYVVYKKLTQYQYDASTKASNQASSLVSQSQGKKKYGFKQFAKGTYGVGEDSIALVGENPNSQELAIGSKLNGGTIMPLKQGTGIIPHNLTSTLVSMAQMFNSGIHNLQPNTTNNDNGLYIDKVVIEGANITDVVSFKNSLMNLKSEATQRAYRHR